MHGRMNDIENNSLNLFKQHLSAYVQQGKWRITQPHTKAVQSFLDKLELDAKFQAALIHAGPLLLILEFGKHLQQEKNPLQKKGTLFHTLLQFLEASQAYPGQDLNKMLSTAICHDQAQEALNRKLVALITENVNSAQIVAILTQGANPNQTVEWRDYDHGTEEQLSLLSLACILNYRSAKALLAFGALPNFKDQHGRSTIGYLLDKKGRLPGHHLFFQNHSDAEILDYFHLGILFYSWEISGLTRRIEGHCKPQAYRIELIKLLAKYGADLTTTNTDGQTLLHWLCDTAMIFTYAQAQFFIDQGLDPLQKDLKGETAFTYLLGHPDLQGEKKQWATHCLEVALLEHNTLMIEALFENCMSLIDLNTPNTDGMTLFHLMLLQGDLDTAIAILAQPSFSNVNTATPGFNMTPLHSALNLNCFAIMIQLLQKGADPTLANYNSETVLDLLVQKKLISLEVKKDFLEQYNDIKGSKYLQLNDKKRQLKVHIKTLIPVIEASVKRKAALNALLTVTTPFFEASAAEGDSRELYCGDGDTHPRDQNP